VAAFARALVAHGRARWGALGTPGLLADGHDDGLGGAAAVGRAGAEAWRPGGACAPRGSTGRAAGLPSSPDRGSSSRRSASPVLQPGGLRLFVAQNVPGATLEELEPLEVPAFVARQESMMRSKLVDKVERTRAKVGLASRSVPDARMHQAEPLPCLASSLCLLALTV